MNPYFIPSICFIFVLYQASEAVHTFQDIKETLNSNISIGFKRAEHMFEKQIVKKSLNYSKVVDCFGFGKKFFATFDRFLRKEANGTNALLVKFHAYTRSNHKRVTLKHHVDFHLDNLNFDIKKRTIFIVHGFLSSGDEKWIETLTHSLLKWDDVNVFAVDWSHGSSTWNYYKAVANTMIVGDQIATFVGQLVDAIEPTNTYGPLHLIGHSVGAHICGYAAKEIAKRESNWKVQRISGLDPAQPCFKTTDKRLRLDDSDAPFVDVIHTNARILAKLGLGLPNPIGHADFYPNGGRIQPGCTLNVPLWKFLPIPLRKISEMICSHGRSYMYFVDSVLASIKGSCTFWAKKWDLQYNTLSSLLEAKCDSQTCIEMGINAEKYNHTGTFFSVTGKSQPFCIIDKDSWSEVKSIVENARRKRQDDVIKT